MQDYNRQSDGCEQEERVLMKRDEKSSSENECKQAITLPSPRGPPGQARTLLAIARPFIIRPIQPSLRGCLLDLAGGFALFDQYALLRVGDPSCARTAIWVL